MSSKPRKLDRLGGGIRAKCETTTDGERVADLSVSLYDSKHSAKELRALAEWLKKAAAWLEDE